MISSGSSLMKGARAESANVVTVDRESLSKDIEILMRKTVEETLNALLDEAAFEPVGAESDSTWLRRGFIDLQ